MNIATRESGGADNRLYRYFFWGSAIFFAVLEIAYFATSKPPFDALNYLIGRDFVNTWMGARAALHGSPALFFDIDRYNEVLHRTFANNLHYHNWSYPPDILLLIWPFGFFPYLTGYVLWLVAGLAAYFWAAKEGAWKWDRFLFLALAPVMFINVITGQNGFFTAALLLSAIANWDKRPAFSGLLFGVLTIKPQLLLLMPLVLALTGRWRVITYAAVTTIVMVVLTSEIFGWEIWREYYLHAMPAQNRVMTHGSGLMLAMMPTPFMNIRLMGLPLQIAWVVQAVFSAIAIGAVVWAYRKVRDPLLSTAMLLTASLLVTPYAFNYDMVALTIVLAKLRDRPESSETDVRFILALWAMPVVMMIVGLFGNIAGSALVLLAFLNRLYQRLEKAEAVQSSASSLTSSDAALSMT